MRRLMLLAGVTVWLAFGGAAPAVDTVLYPAVTTSDEVEVRAGPTAQLYVTNKLRRGESVQVVAELPDGWLKIVPPTGSFSWIHTRHIELVDPKYPNNWMVCVAPDRYAQVLVGSTSKADVKQRVEAARLARGAQVLSVGPSMIDEEGAWLPIQPPPGEYRYVRADGVSKSANPSTAPTTVAKPTDAAVAPTTGATSASTDLAALWQRAQQAERTGQLREAVDLYTQLGMRAQSTHNELATQALNRAHWLRDGLTRVPAQTTSLTPAQPVPFVALSGPVGANPATARPGMLVGSAPVTINGPGVLRVAGRCWEGRRLYRLETARGNDVIVYATAEPGVELEPFVNQRVELVGPTIYCGDLKRNYMRVERVRPGP